MAIEFNSNNYKNHTHNTHKIIEINLFTIISSVIAIFFILLFFNINVFAKSDTPVYEQNSNAISIQNIISQNAQVTKFKEQISGEYYIQYETTYLYNSNLPKDEEVSIQEGQLGKKKMTTVVTYENGQIIEQSVLNEEITIIPTPQITYIGTSEFLKQQSIHLNDIMYVLKNCNLKETADNASEDLLNIGQYLDVTILELVNENWAKISFDGVTGYIETSNLTSATSSPYVVDKNRIQRALLEININMNLSKKSNLSIEDFKKILTNLPSDTNKIFENNYQVFYDVENKYNINGVFMAALAIHESGWGTSKIANDKKNLFGFGAYDSNPYEYAVSFDTYSLGIESVAKHLAKQYLYEAGTPIYNGETAQGLYYNGPTLSGVNTRYATDPDWYVKVFKHMQDLYNRLQ